MEPDAAILPLVASRGCVFSVLLGETLILFCNSGRRVVGSERVQITFLVFAMASCLSSVGGSGNNFDLLTAHKLGEKLMTGPSSPITPSEDLKLTPQLQTQQTGYGRWWI